MKRVICPMLVLFLLPSTALATVDVQAEVVQTLAGPQAQGRGPHTDLAVAADYLESMLGAWGPVQRQAVQVDGVQSNNLILMRAPAQAGAGWVVLGAHYDHLGLGTAGEPNYGTVHPGADDNASGCAVLLGAMGPLMDAGPTARGLAIVLFTGEESGLLGSRAFVADGPLAGQKIVAMVNLDTVGRLNTGELTIFGVETARVFGPALDGLNSVFSLPLRKVGPSSGSSDDMAFVEAGIPALHLFTGAHPEYHRPTDVVGLLDMDGLATLAEFTAELVGYLAAGDVDLSFEDAAANRALADPSRATAGRRRVSLGSIPDFKFEGEGVRISGVLPGSPAAGADLREGDVITAFAGVEVSDLTDYSEAMKQHDPGDVVQVDFLRDGVAMQVEVTLTERR